MRSLTIDEVVDIINVNLSSLKKKEKNNIIDIQIDLIKNYLYPLISHIIETKVQKTISSEDINAMWEFILNIYWAKNFYEQENVKNIERWLDDCPFYNLYLNSDERELFKMGCGIHNIVVVVELFKETIKMYSKIKKMLDSLDELTKENSVMWYNKNNKNFNISSLLNKDENTLNRTNFVEKFHKIFSYDNDPIRCV